MKDAPNTAIGRILGTDRTAHERGCAYIFRLSGEAMSDADTITLQGA